MKLEATTNKKIAFLLSGFPRLSETFILNELLELQRQGLSFSIFALKRENDSGQQSDVQLLQTRPIFVPGKITIRFVTEVILAISAFTFQSPLKFIRVSRRFLMTGKKERSFTLALSFARWVWLCRKFQRKQVHQVHAHFAHDPTTMAFWVFRLLNIPYSFTAHAKDIYCYPQNLLREKIHHARWVTTCTCFNKEHLERCSQNGTPIHRLYHGLNFKKFNGQKKLKRNLPLILAVGRLVEKKGFSYLLEACSKLKEMGYVFACLIVGEGPERASLQQQIEIHNLTKCVHLPGAFAHEELIELYKKCSVFVMPSCVTETGDRDGIPNVVLEALAMEIPVVATDISGIPEVVKNEYTGLLVPQKNASELAFAVQTVLSNPDLAERLGRAGRQTVRSLFDLQTNVQAMKGLLLS